MHAGVPVKHISALDMGGEDNCPVPCVHPSLIPAVFANALRDLSHNNEKQKCDRFHYNVYFHLTINYIPSIGGTSLSFDTSFGEKLSWGGKKLAQGELRGAVSLPGTRTGIGKEQGRSS